MSFTFQLSTVVGKGDIRVSNLVITVWLTWNNRLILNWVLDFL